MHKTDNMHDKESLRLVFVVTEFVTEQTFDGGLANYTHRMAKLLSSLGHDVHIVTRSNEKENTLEFDGIHVHRVKVPAKSTLFSIAEALHLGMSAKRIYFNIKVYQRLLSIQREKNIDAVQYSNVYASGLLSQILFKVPSITRASSYRRLWNKMDRRIRTIDKRICEYLETLQYRNSSFVYTPSLMLCNELKENLQLKNIVCIRPPMYRETIDVDRSIYDECLKDKEYMLYFGRLMIRKGFHVLIKAIPAFLSANPDAYFVCVGEDYSTYLSRSMKEYLHENCAEFTDRIIYMDILQHNQLYPIISGARIVVLPSLMDNLSNACIESMLLGKPVVGTYGSSFEELITDGQSGFLAKPGNVNSLVDKMQEAWNCKDIEEIGLQAFNTIKKHSSKEAALKLVSAFRKVMNQY